MEQDDRKLEIIGQLMEELQDLMGPKEDDFGSRLGREKPDSEIMIMGSGDPGEGGDDGMDDDDEYSDNPDDMLKSRLMKLRG